MKVDQESIRSARQTNLETFLPSLGYTLKREGKNYRVQEFSGVLVKGNMYTDFSNGNGGGNAIDFCQRILKLSFQESIQQLLRHDGRVVEQSSPSSSKQEHVILPEKAANYRRVIAYLNKTRGIPIQVIQELLKEKLLYQDNKGNAVFVCRDENGQDKGAIIRGTLTEKSFKQRIGSGDYPFVWLPSQEKITITLTEAPIDLLSLIALYPESRKTIHAALGGVEFEEAVEQLLQKYPNVKRLILGFDNDEAGRKAVERFKSRFKSRVETMAFFPSDCDWNEQLVKGQRQSAKKFSMER